MSEDFVIKHNNPKERNISSFLSHVGIQKRWVLIDLRGIVLGRVASYVSHRLMGKHRPDYTPHIDCGDNIILINSDFVFLTGDKESDKIYYHHTGYSGGIKSVSASDLRNKQSQRIIINAVRRMIGRGPLAYRIIKKLHIYPRSEHPHMAQQPEVIDFGSMNIKNKKC